MSGARWNQQTHFFSSLTAVSPYWRWGWAWASQVCPWEGIFNAAQHRKRKLGNPAEAKSQLFICRLWEIVLLTSSSFKAHVHLLHVVIVNQAFRVCAFSQLFHLPCVLALRRTVFRITPPCGNDHASLKSWYGLLNYFNKYQTWNSAPVGVPRISLQLQPATPCRQPRGSWFHTHLLMVGWDCLFIWCVYSVTKRVSASKGDSASLLCT